MRTASALATSTAVPAGSPADRQNPRADGENPRAARLRRLPVRETEPPYDDELTGGNDWTGGDSTGLQGALALSFALPNGLPAHPPQTADDVRTDVRPSRRLRLVSPNEAPARPAAPTGRTRRAELDEQFGPQLTPRSVLPDPRLWSGRLVQAIVEISAGTRPVAQLIRWTSAEVYAALQHRAAHALSGERANSRRLAALVRSVHVREPVDGVAEVCAVVQRGRRCAAIALRLEGVDGRWLCTALQLG